MLMFRDNRHAYMSTSTVGYNAVVFVLVEIELIATNSSLDNKMGHEDTNATRLFLHNLYVLMDGHLDLSDLLAPLLRHLFY